MPCTDMPQGRQVKIKAIKKTLIDKLDKQIVEAKKAGNIQEATKISTYLDDLRKKIMSGVLATCDKIGVGPDHQHVFRWGNIFVNVTDVEYETQSVSVHHHH